MQFQVGSRVVLHQAVAGHERPYSLPCQHPTARGLTGRGIALAWPCDNGRWIDPLAISRVPYFRV